MRKNLLVSLGVSLIVVAVFTIQPPKTYGQEAAGNRVCADVPGRTSGTHRFRLGETLEIALRGEGVPESVRDCEPVELKLHWSNGRNNGAMFNVTFLDDNRHPIQARQLPGFLPNVVDFPLASINSYPGNGSSLSMISVPTTVTIQAVEPFSAPAVLSFLVTRVGPAKAGKGEEGNRVKGEAATRDHGNEQPDSQVNEVVRIRSVTRLIGSARIPLVQIELKTAHPFPVRDVPLQLQIGKTVFVDELSGDFTGRRLTLSLTPEMFAELKDGDEIVASFGKVEAAKPDAWSFGKLFKSRRQEQ